ncbi:23S rRNA (adenine(2503)-C(2))-methyltransferase RlmN [Terriglobus roseus]|uniref:Probable dual-specificity RNA methyltransferase RlmN n=1 Tax=Terriglobus roseus TaxID=392734 RepID=A0A1G7Q8Z3_9BACT|nr:23S rRNA (adenine(2503)-C(2))-methyltransferase RlmN [Terriglobus roseus]SDF94944.1 23S rRNA m(2)A-2503 methyltransferase [Terriglobus roseus]
MSALFGKSLPELTELAATLGQKPYRARQIFDALYKQRVTDFDAITPLSQELRSSLAAEHTVGLPEIVQTAVSVDGTERYLMRMEDGETVETVWMPDGDGVENTDDAEEAADNRADAKFVDKRNWGALAPLGYRRSTICISSQVGCAVNCQFCLTAKLGIKRDLTAGEIAGQVAAVLNRHKIQMGKDRINLVFMGMGEPFLNYDNFMKSVLLLVEGIGIPASRMTVSTSGIEPAIRRFAQETVRPNLALSLNGSNDKVREQVMPITRKWNIEKLLDAVNTIPLSKRDWVTFEYVMLGGINDQLSNAHEVLALLKGMHAKVNLIVWNPGPDMPYTQPTAEDVDVFQQTLIQNGLPCYIRRPRGRDIYAACGQLKRTVEPEKPADALVQLTA